ncbi:MAG: response regulator transcription factor [Gammaproteobacteria bacterium]|nr:response regulator transcription factor [Gammaproteobacteria bacterium]
MSDTVLPDERVLLVDDDVELCEMLVRYLGQDGFLVNSVHDGEAGVAAVRRGEAGIVVLDITMPILDGFEALRRIRAFSPVPVLMLTARGDDLDRIVGFEIGADDYLPKPFNPRELSARLRAILRRVLGGRTGGDPSVARRIVVGDVSLDSGGRVVSRAGQPVPMTSTEFAITEQLLKAAGQVVTRELLSEQVLGRRLLPLDRSLDTHVGNVRRKLGPGVDGTPLIRTIRGRGYQYVLPP